MRRSTSRGMSLFDDLLNFQEAVELADAGWVTHLAEGFGFDLANAFAGDAELFADFFQRARVAVAETEAQFEDFAFAFGEAAEDVGQFVFEQAEAGDFGRTLGGFVFDEIAKAGFVAIADGGL